MKFVYFFVKKEAYNNVEIVNKYKPLIILTLDRKEDQRKTENTLRNIVNEQFQKLKEQN